VSEQLAAAGQKCTVSVFGRRNGRYVTTERTVTFARAYAEEVEFIPASGARPAQSRIFVKHPHGSIPMLIVKGSMQPAS
jgi:hypothetical protein